ncbi:MAG: branched-chain amino acid ABC transporter permease [Chloroflexi bacterium]|nr:branched-chain amino acid ABC transporter permease [Chloroflexota bacterium]
MKTQIRSGLTFGLVGGFGIILFGGWAAAVVGIMVGVALGLSLGGKVIRKDPLNTALQALPAAAISAVLFIIISLIQNYFIGPATGKTPSDLGLVIPANLLGALAVILLTCLITGLHGLPTRQEQIGKLIVLAAVIIAFPFIDNATGLRWSSATIYALIFVILGLGLNIVVGFAGLLDLGYAAFFAIGAYTAGILSSPQHNIYLNFWLVIWIAAGVAAISGIALGAPTLPLRGDYLAIVTLGFGEIIPVIFRNLIKVTIQDPITCWVWPGIVRLFGSSTSLQCITFIKDMDLTAGEKGINPIGRPWFPFFGDLPANASIIHGSLKIGNSYLYIGEFQPANNIPWYFLIIAIIIMSVFLIRRLRDSRLGRAWMAVREDELAASQMGIDPVRTKLMAFALGAMFSGFAGAFYASYISGIFPSAFDFSASIIILCVVVLGGLGNINGVIVGALIITTADRLFLPALKDLLTGLMDHSILPALASNHTLQKAVAANADPILYRFLLFGLTLVIMMAVRPEGLIPSAQRKAELHSEEEIAANQAAAEA